MYSDFMTQFRNRMPGAQGMGMKGHAQRPQGQGMKGHRQPIGGSSFSNGMQTQNQGRTFGTSYLPTQEEYAAHPNAGMSYDDYTKAAMQHGQQGQNFGQQVSQLAQGGGMGHADPALIERLRQQRQMMQTQRSQGQGGK